MDRRRQTEGACKMHNEESCRVSRLWDLPASLKLRESILAAALYLCPGWLSHRAGTVMGSR